MDLGNLENFLNLEGMTRSQKRSISFAREAQWVKIRKALTSRRFYFQKKFISVAHASCVARDFFVKLKKLGDGPSPSTRSTTDLCKKH
jgi:hypothetical protein